MTGLFVSFEGGEGSGKTTVIQELALRLQEENYEVLVTREPGGIPISEKIRQVILHPDHTEMEMRTEALLYAAARRQHLVEKILPALQAGKIVLCDRFIDSSLAYQGFARGIGIDEVLSINQFAIEGWMPELTLFLDVRPDIGLQRIRANRSREVNRLDLEERSFHQKVYEGYQHLLTLFPDRILRIDGEASVDEVVTSSLARVKSYLP